MSQTSISANMTAAYAGLLADSGFRDVVSRYNSESSAQMPFGIMVCFGAADDAAILPVDGTTKHVGVVIATQVYDPTLDLGTTGILPKRMISLLRKGRIWVQVEEAVAPGDPVFIRHSTGAGGSQKGAFRKSSDSSTATDLTKKAVFLSTAGAAGLALVDIDMTNN